MRYYSSVASPTTLSAGINNVVTSMTVAAVTGLPATTPYTLVLDPDTASEEIVTVTGVAGTTLTITRGEDGSSATAHDAGAVVKHMVTARDLAEPQTHIGASAAVHGISGSVVGTSDTQTLTNKTLTSPTISGSGSITAASLSVSSSATLPATTSIGDVSATELAILNGATVSTAELNILDGATLSTTELNYLDGVTSAVQTQIDGKAVAPLWYRRTAATSSITTTATTMFATSPSLDVDTWYHFKFFARVPFTYTGTSASLVFNTGFSASAQSFTANAYVVSSSSTTSAVGVSPVSSTTVASGMTGSRENIFVMEGFFQTNASSASTFTPTIYVTSGSITVAAGSHIEILELSSSSASINGTWS
jgi:hypothetical protein